MSKNKCDECEWLQKTRGPGPYFKRNTERAECCECGKVKDKVLDLHHTSAALCSIKCEDNYWRDILF
jgi:hypothetical protein